MSIQYASTPCRVLASLFFFACVGYCALGQASGESFAALQASPSPIDSNGSGQPLISPFQILNRWTTTATDGPVGSAQGTPVTLTWGFVGDGTPISGAIGEPAANSNLIARLDTIYSTSGGADLTTRSWFTHFDSSFERWEELSGLTYNYEPNDGGALISDNTSAPVGNLGSYADHRIGGHHIDGNSGTLAYNYFPNHSDMVIDTNDSFYTNTSGSSIRLRNVVMHEVGHGLGFRHLESNNSDQLMEPFLNTSFAGPQIDDILAVQRNYGDALESNGGNDSATDATSAGLFSGGDAWSIGTDGGSTGHITLGQSDFVSIDGASDEDFYHFTVSEPVLLEMSVTGVGRTYNEGPQNGSQSPLDASTLNDLVLDLLSGPAVSPVIEATGIALPGPGANGEFISSVTLIPGTDYYAQIQGLDDNVQLYQLDISLTALAVPEPASILLLALSFAGLAGSRRV